MGARARRVPGPTTDRIAGRAMRARSSGPPSARRSSSPSRSPSATTGRDADSRRFLACAPPRPHPAASAAPWRRRSAPARPRPAGPGAGTSGRPRGMERAARPALVAYPRAVSAVARSPTAPVGRLSATRQPPRRARHWRPSARCRRLSARPWRPISGFGGLSATDRGRAGAVAIGPSRRAATSTGWPPGAAASTARGRDPSAAGRRSVVARSARGRTDTASPGLPATAGYADRRRCQPAPAARPLPQRRHASPALGSWRAVSGPSAVGRGAGERACRR
jgi:hypothetical protein